MEGGKPTRIWHSRTARADEAAWAPDGRHLAVTTGRGITRMTAAGKDIRRLTRSSGELDPQWSPDGRALAFIRRAHVWIVGKDGSGLRRLGTTAGAFSFLWSPDGRSILFTRERASGDDVVDSIGLVRRTVPVPAYAGAGSAGRCCVLVPGRPEDPLHSRGRSRARRRRPALVDERGWERPDAAARLSAAVVDLLGRLGAVTGAAAVAESPQPDQWPP